MSAPTAARGTGADQSGSSGADDSGLIGREDATQVVSAVLASLPGTGGVLHVSGAAGTGRSAVLGFAARTAAHQGIRVLSTGRAPAERALRHAALHDLLRPELARITELPAAERAVLNAAFGGGPAAPDPAELATATLGLLTSDPRPVLLCVDDLDRLDEASRDTLCALARLCPEAGVGMIVTERATAGPRWPAHLRHLTLEGLPAPQARTVLLRAGRVTGYTEEQLVLSVAGGNPLALTELSLAPGELGDTAGFGMLPATPRLAEAYAEELEGMPAPARDVLLVAALSISPLTRDVLTASSALLDDAAGARAGLTELITRGLVVEEAVPTDESGRIAVPGEETRRLRFPQPLIRPAVLHLESAARRMAAHAHLGQTLTSPSHAAWHTARSAAPRNERLARDLESLADGSHPGTAVLVALAALENAARLSPDPERRAGRLLRAAELAGEHGLMDQALAYARQIDPAELGVLGRALLLWVHNLLPGDSAVGRRRITELCEAAREVSGQDPALTQKLLLAAARRCWWQHAAQGELGMVREAFKDLRSGPRDARDLAVLALTDPLSVTVPPDPPPAPGASEADTFHLLGQVAHLATDLDQAAAFYARAEESVRAGHRYGRLPQILVPRAMGRIWLDPRWDTAWSLAEEGRTVAEGTGQADWATRATATLGILAALRNDHQQALHCAAEVEEASLRLGQSRQLNLATLARALTASGAGRYAEAYTRLRSLFTEPSRPYAYEEFWALAFLAEAALPTGEADDARHVRDEVARVAAAGRAPLLERILAYAEAVLSPDDETEDRYLRALAPGIEAWPLLHGMTRFGYGAWLRRQRRVTASRAPLSTAESLFRALGARSRAEQAAAELRATGTSAADHPAGDDIAKMLSPQQLTIARLAARGLTNRAIGEHLHLSPRTVASHLYQIFPKLGVTSRAQLAARLGAD